MTLSVTSISPEEASGEGGGILEVSGDFTGLLGIALRVHVGPNGDATDPECYSGIVGQGNVIYLSSETLLRCYLPVLEATTGTPHKVFVTKDDDSEDDVLNDALTVLPPQFYSRVFGLRSVFPRFYRMGPRNMDALEPLP